MRSMSNVLEYKGYTTKIEYDSEDKVLYGKIEGIKDLVNFGSEYVDEIEQEFHHAVDSYIQMCEEIGRCPDEAHNDVFGEVETESKAADEMFGILGYERRSCESDDIFAWYYNELGGKDIYITSKGIIKFGASKYLSFHETIACALFIKEMGRWIIENGR